MIKPKTRFHRPIVAAAALVICALPAAGRPQGNVIRGKVRNTSGRNMSQVIVQLETGNGQQINQTVTNNEGDFIFAGLSETSYIIVIADADFKPINEHVEFVRTVTPDSVGEQRTVEITLVPVTGPPAVLSNRIIAGQTVPKSARDLLDRAAKLLKDNKPSEAVAAMDGAIKAYPEYFDAHLMLAGELMKEGRLVEAIAEYEKARQINPKDDRVYQGFAQVLTQQRKFALAAQIFAEAARLNPTDPNILVLRAGALIEQAIAINPEASGAGAERKTAFDLAEKDLGKAFELSGRKLAIVHLHLARIYERTGAPSRAADELEAYLKMVPDDPKTGAIREGIKTLRHPNGKP